MHVVRPTARLPPVHAVIFQNLNAKLFAVFDWTLNKDVSLTEFVFNTSSDFSILSKHPFRSSQRIELHFRVSCDNSLIHHFVAATDYLSTICCYLSCDLWIDAHTLNVLVNLLNVLCWNCWQWRTEFYKNN